MNNTSRHRKTFIFRAIAPIIIAAFLGNTIILPTKARAQSVLNLPVPGAMLSTTTSFSPPMIRGITIYPKNPFRFDFIIDSGDDNLKGDALKQESNKLIKYFLASLTVPEEEMWVNLSPYEKDRIIANGLSYTEMGKDLLAQDYILKQLTASLMYPEDNLGNEFWERVYAKAQEKYGTTEIPINTFNKIWIVPDKATVYVKGANVFVAESYLKVMLEEDYLALESNAESTKHGLGVMTKDDIEVISGVSSEVIREILIPEIEKEVNSGKHFLKLRQIYNSMILASWYKLNLKNGLLGQVYVDKNKSKGINLEDREINQRIYDQYVEAFKKGVFDFIKEDYDSATQEIIPRKYFSGGLDLVVSKRLQEAQGDLKVRDSFQGLPHTVSVYLETIRNLEKARRLLVRAARKNPTIFGKVTKEMSIGEMVDILIVWLEKESLIVRKENIDGNELIIISDDAKEFELGRLLSEGGLNNMGVIKGVAGVKMNNYRRPNGEYRIIGFESESTQEQIGKELSAIEKRRNGKHQLEAFVLTAQKSGDAEVDAFDSLRQFAQRWEAGRQDEIGASITDAALLSWDRAYASRNDFVNATTVTTAHYEYGVASRDKYTSTYKVLDRVASKILPAAQELWPDIDFGEDDIQIFLLESDVVNAYYLPKTNQIYFSLGLLQFFRKLTGELTENDIAFILAHELAHHVQKKTGIVAQNLKEVQINERHADNLSLRIINQAGYSVKDIERVIDYLTAYHDKQANDIPIEKRRVAREKVVRMLDILQQGGSEETMVSQIIQQRTELFGIIDESGRNSLPYLLLKNVDPTSDRDINSFKNLNFVRRSLEYLVRHSDLIRRKEYSFKGILSFSDEQLEEGLRENLDYLEVILKTYLLKIDNPPEEQRSAPSIPYLSAHPVDAERRAAIVTFRTTEYMNSYNNPIEQLTDLDEELDQPMQSQSNLLAIKSTDGLTTSESIAQKLFDHYRQFSNWQEGLVFLSTVNRSFLSESLYRLLMNSTPEIEDDVQRVSLMHQMNFLFGKQEQNKNLIIEQDPIWFYKYSSVFIKNTKYYFLAEYYQYLDTLVEKAREEIKERMDADVFYQVLEIYVQRRGQKMENNLYELISSRLGISELLKQFAEKYDGNGVDLLSEDQQIFILRFVLNVLFEEPTDSQDWNDVLVFPILVRSFEKAKEVSEQEDWDLMSKVDILQFFEAYHGDWEQDFDRYFPYVKNDMFDSFVDLFARTHYEKQQDKDQFVVDFTTKLRAYMQENNMPLSNAKIFYKLYSYRINDLMLGIPGNFEESYPIFEMHFGGENIYRLQQMSELKVQLEQKRLAYIIFEMENGTRYKVTTINEVVESIFFNKITVTTDDGQVLTFKITGDKIKQIYIVRRNVSTFPEQASFFSRMKQSLKEGMFSDVPQLIDDLQSPYSVVVLSLLSQGFLLPFENLEEDWLFNMPVEALDRLYQLMKNHISAEFLKENGLDQIHDAVFRGTPFASPFIDTYDQYLMAIYNLILKKNTGKEYSTDRLKLMGEVGRNDHVKHRVSYLSFLKNQEAGTAPFWRRRAQTMTPETRHRGSSIFPIDGSEQDGRFSKIDGTYTVDAQIQEGITVGYVQEREQEFVDYLIIRGSLDSKVQWQSLSWPEVVGLINENMPTSVLRNYLLYYLFFERVLQNYCNCNMENMYELDEIVTEVRALTPKMRSEIFVSFHLMSTLFANDEFMQRFNENVIEGYFFRNKFDEIGDVENRQTVITLEQREETFYQENQAYFEPNFQFLESGTILNYLDLMLAQVFAQDLEETLASQNDVNDRINTIVQHYPRSSNTRDRWIMKSIEELEKTLPLNQWQRVYEFADGDILKNRAGLFALQGEVDQVIAQEGSISFEQELALIQRYFPSVSIFRDDILSNFERGNTVQSRGQVNKVRSLYSFDFDRLTEDEVSDRVEIDDNMIMILDMVSPEEKQDVLFWMAGLDAPKPRFIMKLELIHYSNMDSLREMNILSTDRYGNVGRTGSLKFFDALLRKGEDSIISQGLTLDFVDRLWSHVLDEFDLDPASKDNKIIRATLMGLFKHLEGNDLRIVKILSEFMLGMDTIRKDDRFKDYSNNKKIGYLAKTLLGATGVIGIKLAQHLAVSKSMNLDPEIKEILLELTEGAEGLDKKVIFSMLRQLRVELESDETLIDLLGGSFTIDNIYIKEIKAAASIKTSFIPVLVKDGQEIEMDEIWKAKNLSAIYDAVNDLEILSSIIDDLVSQNLISLEHGREIVESMKAKINEELDFEFEKANTERMQKNALERVTKTGLPLKYRFIRRFMRLFLGKLNHVQIKYTKIDKVVRGDLVREKLVKNGVSLKEFMANPSNVQKVGDIKKKIIIEIMSQYFEDGFYHADLHPGNIMIVDQGDGLIDVVLIDMGGVGVSDQVEQAKMLSIINKTIRKKMFAFITRSQGDIDISKEIESLSFKSQEFLDKISYLFAAEGAVADSAMMSNQAASSPVNAANIVDEEVGGIDLNPNMLELQTQGEDMDLDISFDPQTIQSIQIDGFSPVIFQIVPSNLPMLLGDSNVDREKQLSLVQ